MLVRIWSVDCCLDNTMWGRQDTGLRRTNCCFNGSWITTTAMRQSTLDETNEMYAVSKAQIKQRLTAQLLHSFSFNSEVLLQLWNARARFRTKTPRKLPQTVRISTRTTILTEVFVVLLRPSTQMKAWCLKWGHERFFPYPFQFNIHYHPVIRRNYSLSFSQRR
jgi:hypothetical protein